MHSWPFLGAPNTIRTNKLALDFALDTNLRNVHANMLKATPD